MTEDLALPVYTNFERRWRAFEERLHRSMGQYARHANVALAQTAARVREELRLPNEGGE